VDLPTNVLLMVLISLILMGITIVMLYKRIFIYALSYCALTIGILLNTIVVLANGNKMPVAVEPWRTLADQSSFGVLRQYSPITDTTRLWWLGDIFDIGLGRMNSIGDIIMILCLCAAIIRLTYLFVHKPTRKQSHNK